MVLVRWWVTNSLSLFQEHAGISLLGGFRILLAGGDTRTSLWACLWRLELEISWSVIYEVSVSLDANCLSQIILSFRYLLRKRLAHLRVAFRLGDFYPLVGRHLR